MSELPKLLVDFFMRTIRFLFVFRIKMGTLRDFLLEVRGML